MSEDVPEVIKQLGLGDGPDITEVVAELQLRDGITDTHANFLLSKLIEFRKLQKSQVASSITYELLIEFTALQAVFAELEEKISSVNDKKLLQLSKVIPEKRNRTGSSEWVKMKMDMTACKDLIDTWVKELGERNKGGSSEDSKLFAVTQFAELFEYLVGESAASYVRMQDNAMAGTTYGLLWKFVEPMFRLVYGNTEGLQKILEEWHARITQGAASKGWLTVMLEINPDWEIIPEYLPGRGKVLKTD